MATEEELKQIAAQLRCPDGEHGLLIADNMNQTNIGMTTSTIAQLDLRGDERILELGYGNAGHIPSLIASHPDLSYIGLDISQTMLDEAMRMHRDLLDEKSIQFAVYNGRHIPYENDSFDKIFTVNTIYFWEDSVAMMNELSRVLRPDGHLVVTFADKQFMQTLPFTTYGFRLYNVNDLKAILPETSMELDSIFDYREKVTSKVGEEVERLYYVALLRHRR